jgi:hypothetical protein
MYRSIERRQDMSFGYLLPGAHPTFVARKRCCAVTLLMAA